MSCKRIAWVALLAVTVVGGTASIADARQVAGAGQNGRTDEARAQALYKEAVRHFNSPARHAYSAELLVESAQLLPVTNPIATPRLVMAARLYGHAGDMARAGSVMELAATRALESGDVIAAANAFADAAIYAVEQNQPQRARALVARARALAQSPLLDVAQRAAIMERTGTAAIVAESSDRY